MIQITLRNLIQGKLAQLMVFLMMLSVVGCEEKKVEDDLDEKLDKAQSDFNKSAGEAMKKLKNLNDLKPVPPGDRMLLKVKIAEYDSTPVKPVKK